MNNNDPLSKEAQELRLGIYRHFKGHDVTVIGVARHTEDPAQEFVTYYHDHKIWIRPLGMFLENVNRDGYNGPRFIFVGPEGKIKVGIGVNVFKEGKILLGKRKSKLGQGEYASPGGHLEFAESFEECAEREVFEETGIKIKNLQFTYLANATSYPPNQYVHIGFTADYSSGEPLVKEPDKCESWDWYDIDHLPEPIFIMTLRGIESYKQKKIYYSGKI